MFMKIQISELYSRLTDSEYPSTGARISTLTNEMIFTHTKVSYINDSYKY